VSPLRRQNNFGRLRLATGLLGVFFFAFAASAATTNVVLRLNNGDRITGTLLAADTNQLLVATSWLPALPVPLGVITNQEFTVVETPPVTVAVAMVQPQTNQAAAKPPPVAAKPAPKKLWRTDIRLGTDFQSGAKDRSLYWGTFKLTYERPFKENPKKFFRNVLDYRADYGETEGDVSVNRMSGSMKTDFDLTDRWYLYNLGIIGYDEIRKIELGYEIGPGMGYHMLVRPKFVFDTEAGLNYQYQDRTDEAEEEAVYLRFAESITWKIAPQVTFTEKFEFYPTLESIEDFRFRFESTLSLGIVQNLSINFSVLDIYDTKPARTVDRNELLVRSSLGLSF
jgi:putative salt-induced outer membrane protein YdiY